MNKLLSAGFARLRKDKVFWFCMIFMFFFGVYMCLQGKYNEVRMNIEISLENIFFSYIILIGVFLAIFCSLFVGTEHSDGTMRNKLVVGHRRHLIYLSNCIVCIAAGFFMTLAYVAAVGMLGIPLFGFFQVDIMVILAFFLCGLAVTLALTSIYTMVSMQNQNKAMASIINIVGFFALLFVAALINSRLSEPAVYESYYYMDAAGNMVTTESMPNPNYLQGMKRSVYEFFLDFLPTGQVIQISNMAAVHLGLMSLYSLLITIVTTLGGIFCFQKKDIK